MTVGELKQLVKDTLSAINAPVGYQAYGGSQDTYFTFFILSDGDVAWGDGEPLVSGVHIQLDGWSKGDMDDLCDTAKSRMKAAGFLYELGRDLYEPDTKIFHRIQQFYICKEE